MLESGKDMSASKARCESHRVLAVRATDTFQLVTTTNSSSTGFPEDEGGSRLHCRWKGCSYQTRSPGQMRYHVREHGKCPKPGCKWEGARDDKHRTRHVWVNHSKWAKRVTFPSNGASCYLCGSLLKREDYVRRHIKEVHNGEKRKRKIGQRIAQELTS
ncbi:hypothetical protein EV126DRAFT_423847 [Verticillium dahliae]|nr:hypothetical protein EV126DRAFT_423847 [Verticillium dahliae]